MQIKNRMLKGQILKDIQIFQEMLVLVKQAKRKPEENLEKLKELIKQQENILTELYNK